MATEHVERRIEITATTNGVDQAAQKLSNLASAHKGVAGAAEETNVTLDSLDRRLNAIQRRFDQNYRAQKDFEKVERELNTLRKAERITEERRVQLLGMAEAQLKKNTTAQTAFITSTRQLQQANDNAARVAKQTYALHAGQIASLRSQAVDVGTMLALGANPFQIIASQGGQVYEALAGPKGVTGSLKAIASGALALVTPVTVAFTGIAAAIGLATYAAMRYNAEQKEIERSLTGQGRGTHATVSQLTTLAEANAEAARVSVSSAREMVATYAATGRIGTDMMDRLMRVQQQYARQTKQELPEATAELARAFADPEKGAQILSERFGSLGDKTVQLISRQMQAGDLLGAQKTLFDALNPTLSDHEVKLTGIWKAWDQIKRAASDAMSGFGATLAPTLEQQAETARKALENAQRQRALLNNEAGRTGSPLLDGPLQNQAAGPLAGPDTIRELERRAVRLESDVVIEQAMRELEAREAEARATSERVGELVRQINPEITQLQTLKDRRNFLEKALKDENVLKELGVSAEEANAALSKLNVHIGSSRTASEQMAYDHQQAMAAITARTTAEKAALAAEQAREAARQKGLDVTQQSIAAEQARTRVIAEANQQISEALRVARLGAAKIGMSPYQQRQQQITDDFAERRKIDPNNADLDELEAFERKRAAYEFLQKPMEDANRNLDEQIELLDAQERTLGGTTAQIRAAEEATRLLNEAHRQGLTEAALGKEAYAALTAQIGAYAERAGAVAERMEALERQKQVLQDIKDVQQDALKGFLTDLKNGKSFADALTSALDKLFDKIWEMMLNSLFEPNSQGGFNIIGLISKALSGSSDASGGSAAASVGSAAFQGLGKLPSVTSTALPAPESFNSGGWGGDPYAGAAITQAATKVVSFATNASLAMAEKAIKGIESSGGNYDIIGPWNKTGTDRPYGAYQVMGSNVGPWTEKYFGTRLTPSQFLENRDAQDAVFQGEFGRLMEKYGPEGAARAWFAGEGGMNKFGRTDSLGTSVRDYSDKFQSLYTRPGPQAFNGSAGNDNLIGGTQQLSESFDQLSQTSAQLSPNLQQFGTDFQSMSQSLQGSVPQISQNLTQLGNTTAQGGNMVGSALDGTANVIGQGANGIGSAINHLGHALSSMGGGGGFGGLFGSLFGGGNPFTNGGSLDWGQFMGGVSFGYHEGGLVGRDHSFTRAVDPSLFANAPRFHKGLRPGELPAILEEGEWVLSREDVRGIKDASRAANSNPVNDNGPRVTVHNYGPTEAHVEEREDGSFEVYVDALEARFAEKAAKGKGQLYKGVIGRTQGKSLRG